MAIPPLSAVFSPRVKAPLIWTVSKTVNELYRLAKACGFRPEFLVIFFGPPVFDITFLIVLRALIVKGMRHFMTNDHADTAVVDGVICRKIKVRILQDTRGENHLVLMVDYNRR
jgi:hypothetical protein